MRRLENTLLAHVEPVIVRIVLEGDARIVYDELVNLAWITIFEVFEAGTRSIWTLRIQGQSETATDLLRVILADRQLQVIEFVVRPPSVPLNHLPLT